MKVILRPSDRSSSPWLRRQWERVRQVVRALVQSLRRVLPPRHGALVPIPIPIRISSRQQRLQRPAPQRSR